MVDMNLVASLFDMILLRKPADHGPDGLFFCMNGEVEAGRITAALAEAFHSAGIFENTQAMPLPESDLKAGPVSTGMLFPSTINPVAITCAY
jgi:hypothetical protein